MKKSRSPTSSSRNRTPSLAAEIDPKVQAYFGAHGLKCHDADDAKGDFRIDTLSKKVGVENTPQWIEIMERINSGEMPPKKVKTRPTADESAAVVAWISSKMKEGEAARMAARNRVSNNGLTRDEYVNTVRDLIGVHYDAKDPGAFLDDPEWHGFERIGSVLTLSPSNIEKYLGAAEVILNEAYPDLRVAPRAGGQKQNPPLPRPRLVGRRKRSLKNRCVSGTARGCVKWDCSTKCASRCGRGTCSAIRC